MHSLEPECWELAAAGLIGEDTVGQSAALENGRIFSLFEELRFALYAAIAAVTAGVGLLVKNNLQRTGPVTLICALALAAACCYAAALRVHRRRQARSTAMDYLLLLGALIASADLGYAESRFHWLGGEWQWYLLMLAAFHALTAYALSSRLVLCAALAALASWFGIQGHAALLLSIEGTSLQLGTQAIICTATIMVWRTANRLIGGPGAFEQIFDNFAINIGFWGALALSLAPGARLAGLATLIGLAGASISKSLRSRQEIFAIYGTAYTALALCCIESQVMGYALSVLLLELLTVSAGALALWNFHQRLKAART